MIVISGALVLLAAVLLFIGLIAGGSSLTAIYVSIGLSIVAAVFLWMGINQRPAEVPVGAGARGGADPEPRRGRSGRSRDSDEDEERPASRHRKPPPAREPDSTEVRAVESAEPALDPDDLVEDSDDKTVQAAVATGADVVVVSGFPRYHLDVCPAVDGNDEAEALPIGEARELGFVPCGICRPDAELAEQAAGTAEQGAAGATAGGAQSAGAPDLVNAPPAVASPPAAAAAVAPPAVAPPPQAPQQVQQPAPPTAPQPGWEAPAVAPPPGGYPEPVAPAHPVAPAAHQPPVAQPPAAPPAAVPPPTAQPPVGQPAQPVAYQQPAVAAPPTTQPPAYEPPPTQPAGLPAASDATGGLPAASDATGGLPASGAAARARTADRRWHATAPGRGARCLRHGRRAARQGPFPPARLPNGERAGPDRAARQGGRGAAGLFGVRYLQAVTRRHRAGVTWTWCETGCQSNH